MEAISVQPSAKDESKQFYQPNANGNSLKASCGNPSFLTVNG
jgi:hypothetical protein